MKSKVAPTRKTKLKLGKRTVKLASCPRCHCKECRSRRQWKKSSRWRAARARATDYNWLRLGRLESGCNPFRASGIERAGEFMLLESRRIACDLFERVLTKSPWNALIENKPFPVLDQSPKLTNNFLTRIYNKLKKARAEEPVMINGLPHYVRYD